MEATTGEIKLSSSSFEWKIKNFASLSDRPGECYRSPSFDFYNATWCLLIYPNGNGNDYSGYLSLFLKKLNYPELSHAVFQALSIKKIDGTKHISRESKNEHYNNNSAFGRREFVKRSDVLELIAPDNDLTISCIVSWDPDVANAASETVSKKSKDEDKANSAKEKDVMSNADKGVISAVIDSKKLLRDMETLFSNGQDSDVTLVVQDRKFPVHRTILGIRSPVFAAMFKHDTEEKTSGVVNIADFDPEVFHEFLLYLYTAKVEKLSLETAVGLYSAADKYSTQELKTKCVEFMRDNLSLDMFCSVVSLALQHEESSLLEATTKFFVKNLKQIVVTVDWQAFMKENPAAANELIIKASDFHVPPEK